MEKNNEYIHNRIKKLPIEYQILNLRMMINQQLYEKETISFDIFERMQNLLMKKMNQFFLEGKRTL